MSEVTYGAQGSAHGKCPRCGRGSDSHEITRCSISDATLKGVQNLLSSTKAISGPSLVADRMVGALVAMTSTGKEIKLVAVSGPSRDFKKVVGWDLADITVPEGAAGWMDVYGRKFSLPAEVPVGNACAAIKLLMKLGELRNSSGAKYTYNSIHLYEEAVRATDTDKVDSHGRAKAGKSKRLARWRGQGVEYVYAAHSCDACSARVPLLLCSNPTDS